jgi:hypothetical protein
MIPLGAVQQPLWQEGQEVWELNSTWYKCQRIQRIESHNQFSD